MNHERYAHSRSRAMLLRRGSLDLGLYNVLATRRHTAPATCFLSAVAQLLSWWTRANKAHLEGSVLESRAHKAALAPTNGLLLDDGISSASVEPPVVSLLRRGVRDPVRTWSKGIGKLLNLHLSACMVVFG